MTALYEPFERKVHLHKDQGGLRIPGTVRGFANTLCRMNSDVPATHITKDASKVTCKLCLKAMPALKVYAPTPQPSHASEQPLRRFRYRSNWAGSLILQVCETVPTNFDPQHDLAPGGYTERWRDAKIEDITE